MANGLFGELIRSYSPIRPVIPARIPIIANSLPTGLRRIIWFDILNPTVRRFERAQP